jgi:hypothetical protein
MIERRSRDDSGGDVGSGSGGDTPRDSEDCFVEMYR